MPAPKGHPRWGNPLNPKLYTPEGLWEEACKYFDWANKNPWHKIEQTKQPQRLPQNYDKAKHGSISAFLKQVVKIPVQRPYTIEGLCNFLNISVDTFLNYSNKAGYETYFGVSARIREVINNQQLEGGLVGAFDSGIVARKLGLADKKELSGELKIEQITGMEVK